MSKKSEFSFNEDVRFCRQCIHRVPQAAFIEAARREGYQITKAGAAIEVLDDVTISDTVGLFFDAMCAKATFEEPRKSGWDANGKPNGDPIKPHDWATSSRLYLEYTDWCAQNNYKKFSAPAFKRRMIALGFKTRHTNAGRFFNVRLREGHE
jgi:hypothetical protein